MKTTAEYLQAAKEKIGAESDSALGKAIGLGRNSVGQYMRGERIMDDYTCAQVAQILGLSLVEVIAAANAERERTTERRDYWRNLWEATTQKAQKAASLAVLALGILIGAAGTTESSGLASYDGRIARGELNCNLCPITVIVHTEQEEADND
ncbi:hypothetical protein [Chitinimonas lacunae]|uniref:HTH cro/C1-type domain-containing protein n=1 Tax=Chitinimonas lacunae TaxID=1963018 RepID=A0ABV8MJY4_9NEIS